jgi:hypothetical protein
VTHINDLRRTGLSYGRITKRLQADGYRTKTGVPWSATVVNGIAAYEEGAARGSVSIEAVARSSRSARRSASDHTLAVTAAPRSTVRFRRLTINFRHGVHGHPRDPRA